MTITIDTTEDFLNAMRENPEFLAAARREILTEELIALPGSFESFRNESAGRLDSLERDMGVVKGAVHGFDLQSTGLSMMTAEFRLRRTRIVRLSEYNRASEDFNDAVWDAVDDGTISEAERVRLTVTDMIVRGRPDRDADTHLYLVAEASYTIDGDDVRKVRAGAASLRKIFPRDTVLACLYGVEVDSTLLAEAEADGIHVFINE